MRKLIIIGLGGIGSQLLPSLLQFLNYESEKSFKSVWLVDGDHYEEKNKNRQLFNGNENKAISQVMTYNRLYTNLSLSFIDKYVTKDNISKIVKNDDVVLLCVDNNATRKMFNEYLLKDTIKDLTIISGGNEYFDGNVMISVKRDGVMLTKTFSELHPEILEDVDKNPDELSCEELSNSSGNEQIGLINASVADSMRLILFSMLKGRGINYEEVFISGLTGNTRNVQFNNPEKRLKIRELYTEE